MKYILLILAAVGLTACSNGVVKNESGAEISVEGNSVNDGACYEWTVVFGFIGDSSVAIKTTGDAPTQVGDKEAYDVGYYVVKSTANEAAAVESQDEAPQCEPVEEDPAAAAAAVEAAKKEAVEAADAAVTAAVAAVAKAESIIPHPGPPAFLTQEKVDEIKAAAAAAKAKADEAKAEAEAAETEEAANAAKAKADEAKEEAEAV